MAAGGRRKALALAVRGGPAARAACWRALTKGTVCFFTFEMLGGFAKLRSTNDSTSTTPYEYLHGTNCGCRFPGLARMYTHPLSTLHATKCWSPLWS